LTRGDPPHPGLLGGGEGSEALGERARGEIAELMAADAAHVLYPHQIAIAATRHPLDLVLARYPHQCVPIGRRIALGRRRSIRGWIDLQIEERAGLRGDLGGVRESVSADP